MRIRRAVLESTCERNTSGNSMDDRSILLIIIGASVAGIAIVVVLVLVIWCVLLKEPKDDESDFLQRLRTKLKGRGPEKRLMDLELQDIGNTLQGDAKPQPLPVHDELTSQCYRLRLAKSTNCYLLNDQGVATVGPRGWYPAGFELWRLVPVWEFMSPTTRSYRIVSVAHSGMTGLASLDHFAVQVSSSVVTDPVAHQWILLPEEEGTRFLLENVLTASALCVKEKKGAHLSFIDHQDFDQQWLLEAETCSGVEPSRRFELRPDTPYYVQTMSQSLTAERYPKLTAIPPEKSTGHDVWFIRKVDSACLEKQCLSSWEEVYHVGVWHPEYGEQFITATEHRAVELKSPAGNSISALLSRQPVEWSQCWSLRTCAGGNGVALRSLLHPSMSLANCGGTIRLETNRPCPAQLFVFQEVL